MAMLATDSGGTSSGGTSSGGTSSGGTSSGGTSSGGSGYADPPSIAGGFITFPPWVRHKQQGSGTTGGGGASDPLGTVADAFISALGSAPTNPGATVLVPATDTTGGSGMNWKGIVILAVIAGGAYFLWKKYGKSAAAAA